eukprot:TRINITY_DN2093_c0_g1_i1.p1 TRINITY_DN2093_c0_g1~~TRINITY_DN2093_c0_g1_i1.p1  ORF type:complete len:403 (+),score=29.16 TRINITY_DN2093_c0_g1_i1:172-1380(+)
MAESRATGHFPTVLGQGPQYGIAINGTGTGIHGLAYAPVAINLNGANNRNAIAMSKWQLTSKNKLAQMSASDAPLPHLLYKTKLCRNWLQSGACPYFQECQFAHGEQELQSPGIPIAAALAAASGPAAALGAVAAAAILSNPALNPRFKTKLCTNWQQTGNCPYRHTCLFAHGTAELRSLQDASFGSLVQPNPNHYSGPLVLATGTASLKNSSQGSSHVTPPSPSSPTTPPSPTPNATAAAGWKYKTKMCVNWEATGNCLYGDVCQFAHGEEELRAFRLAATYLAERAGAVAAVAAAAAASATGTVPLPANVQGVGLGVLDTSGIVQLAIGANAATLGKVLSAPDATKYKTKLCINWQAAGTCRYGDICMFAHGPTELVLPGTVSPLGSPATPPLILAGASA